MNMMRKYIGLLSILGISFNVYYFFYYSINEQEESLYTQINLQHGIVKRKITLYNSIEKKDIAYRYFGSEHFPNTFCIKANKQVLGTDNPLELEIYNNSIEFTYTYSFAKGLYKGTKKIKVPINPKCDVFKVTFNWKKRPRIRILEH
jgi:hypothetical protein